jgi:hypothetical protein
MNMVIHDLRNPTVSIKMGLQNTILKLSEMEEILGILGQYDEDIFELFEIISKGKEDDNEQIPVPARINFILEQTQRCLEKLKSSSKDFESKLS